MKKEIIQFAIDVLAVAAAVVLVTASGVALAGSLFILVFVAF